MNTRSLAILVAVFVVAGAAGTSAGEVSVGLKGGLIMTNVTGIPEEWEDAQSYRTGFSGGAFLNYAFDEALSLQPELLYVPKGFSGTLYDGFIDVDASPRFEFLELPVLLKYTFSGGGKLHPCVFAGPSIGFAMSSKLKISVGWLSSSIDISSVTNDVDFGVVAGAGFGYETNRGLITFDARYQRGFTNIIESTELDINGSTQTISVDEFKHYGFAFLAGFQF